ncbi:MAG: LysR family transcriptional regulator [Acidimicrobiia bacterium]|nr:LysR family transcriptional regulator [Acidimicrobiia bacterium]
MSSIHGLDRHHYQLLLAFRDTGHLGRAADRLAISPSAASHRLREAERRLGVTLAEPHGRSLRLTAAGTRLAATAAAAEATLRAGEDAARWLGSTARPTVRLALDFFDRAPWFYRYGGIGRFPFRVDVVRVSYGGAAEAVARRIVDIGFRVVAAEGPDGEIVGEDVLAAAVPTDHPAAERGVFEPADVTSAPYLTAGEAPEPGFETERFLEPAGVFPENLVMIESMSTILQLVAAGRGLTIQPRTALIPTFEGTVVVPLSGSPIPVRWEILTRPDPSDDVAVLVEAIRLAGGSGTPSPAGGE